MENYFRIILLSVGFLAAFFSAALGEPRRCSPRKPTNPSMSSSVYCVCNSTYCDDVPQVFQPRGEGKYTLVSSGKNGQRFLISEGNFAKKNPTGGSDVVTTLIVDEEETYQEIIGFGTSATDAAGMNIRDLSESAQEEFLKSFFSEDGIQYNLIRVPMGATDFSTRGYSYAMKKNDILLKDFALAQEDFDYKIPFLKKAFELNDRRMKLIASPWSASPWMKTNGQWTGPSSLKREYWQMWANYFAKFFDAYRKEGLDFWGLTPQNEPMLGFLSPPIALMGWSAADERDWVINFLSPILEEGGYGNLSIIIGDGMRHLLPDWPKVIMGDPEGRRLVAGTGVHWYLDGIAHTNRLDETHQMFPEKFIIYTESSSGVFDHQKVELGSWSRAENYAQSIIETISHWVSGWIDWNMAVDLQGGPNWLKNFVDATVIVNKTADEFYKQPTFYVMGHFAKYVTPGSVKIGVKNRENRRIPTVAFKRSDNATVVVLLNTYIPLCYSPVGEKAKTYLKTSLSAAISCATPRQNVKTEKKEVRSARDVRKKTRKYPYLALQDLPSRSLLIFSPLFLLRLVLHL
ncbi:putative glucosylceramidase 4 [Athalia rosae]|uniref:putative glucosylceramidase 4 n=1 Tax=Athalia rosae TaxID=37344 RepID=UPI0020338C71|nr:putative glucosylceramidase 4 [Athalia rosae]